MSHKALLLLGPLLDERESSRVVDDSGQCFKLKAHGNIGWDMIALIHRLRDVFIEKHPVVIIKRADEEINHCTLKEEDSQITHHLMSKITRMNEVVMFAVHYIIIAWGTE